MMGSRTLNEPEALWVRIIKGLYFPNTDFRSTRKGGRVSQVWASITHGRDVFYKEGMWHIEYGTDVRIFDDPWVATKPGYRVEWLSEGGPTLDLLVHGLIRPNQEWHENTIRGILNYMDENLILNMPLRAAPSKD